MFTLVTSGAASGESFVKVCTESFHFDNAPCRQGRKFCQNGNISVPVYSRYTPALIIADIGHFVWDLIMTLIAQKDSHILVNLISCRVVFCVLAQIIQTRSCLCIIVSDHVSMLSTNGRILYISKVFSLWPKAYSPDLRKYVALQWRHNGCDCVSKSPASRLFIQAEIKENIKAPRQWPLCGEFTGAGEFPAQMASNAENVSILWRHHGKQALTYRCQIDENMWVFVVVFWPVYIVTYIEILFTRNSNRMDSFLLSSIFWSLSRNRCLPLAKFCSDKMVTIWTSAKKNLISNTNCVRKNRLWNSLILTRHCHNWNRWRLTKWQPASYPITINRQSENLSVLVTDLICLKCMYFSYGLDKAWNVDFTVI